MLFFGAKSTESHFELGVKIIARLNQFYSAQYRKTYTSSQIASAMGIREQALIEGLGLSFDIGLDRDEDKLDAALKRLVSDSGGKIPSKATLDMYLREEAQNYTFIEAAVAVATGTAKEIGKKAAEIGDGVLFMTKIAPYAIGAFLLYKAYKVIVESDFKK